MTHKQVGRTKTATGCATTNYVRLSFGKLYHYTLATVFVRWRRRFAPPSPAEPARTGAPVPCLAVRTDLARSPNSLKKVNVAHTRLPRVGFRI